jgi:hypothetical protein
MSAHDTRIEIGGDVYWVRRDFDLMRRVEQAFGALADLDQKLRRCGLTADELHKLTVIALRSQVSRATDEDIQSHIVDAGIREASDQLALLVLHLFSGHRRAVAWLEAEAKREAGLDAAEDPPAAAPTPVSSTGTDGSRRLRGSAGRRASSGKQPTTT